MKRFWPFAVLVGLELLLCHDTQPLYEPRPAPPLPSPNARDTYNAACELLQFTDEITAAAKLPEPVFDQPVKQDPPAAGSAPVPAFSTLTLSDLLAANQPAVEKLQEGLGQPYQELGDVRWHTTFPHYVRYRRLVRVLSLTAREREQEGKLEEALSLRLMGLRVGSQIPHGGSLIGFLVGRALEHIARKRMATLVPQLPGDAAGDAARQLLAWEGDRVTVAESMRVQQDCDCASLAEALKGTGWSVSWAIGSTPLSQREKLRIWLQAQFAPGAQVRVLSDDFERRIAELSKPYPERRAVPDLSVCLAAQVGMVDVGKASLRAASNETANAMLIVALALRSYEAQHHGLPATLSELAPECLPRVPTDPFTAGEPLHYERLKDGYRLYSVGPDGVDDGGRAIVRPKPEQHWVALGDLGDMVWGINE